jgi:hypothetical protein
MESRPKKLKITLENAVCTEYFEKYDLEHQVFDSVNDLLAVFTVKADGANLGSVNLETK